MSQEWDAGHACYVFAGNICVSGRVESVYGGVASVRLVTGHVVSRVLSELRRESPRLQCAEDWPV